MLRIRLARQSKPIVCLGRLSRETRGTGLPQVLDSPGNFGKIRSTRY